jgi:hypothetical protein
MVEKCTLNDLATALVENPRSQHANCTLPQNLRVALCCVTKLHILVWPFIDPSTRCTCVMIMLLNQLFDLPHLSDGCIIWATGM